MTTVASGKRSRVLIADDDDAIRTLVGHVLRRAGFDVVAARDGREAIQWLDGSRFDAVVLDLMMPRVDGFGVVEHIIETQPETAARTIVVTAFPETAARERLHHICHVLSKPFETQELTELVRECAGLQSRHAPC